MANFTGLACAAPFDSTHRETTQTVLYGTKMYDYLGNEYTYVKATATIPVMSAVTFTGSAVGWDDVVVTSDVNQFVVGIATTAFAANDFGFLLTRGIAEALVVDSTAAGSVLVSAADGVLKLATESESLAGANSAVCLVSAADSSTAGTTVRLG